MAESWFPAQVYNGYRLYDKGQPFAFLPYHVSSSLKIHGCHMVSPGDSVSRMCFNLILPSGAGPAGICLASCITHYSDPSAPVHVDLYESQPEIATVGLGIGVGLRSLAMFKYAGIMDRLEGELGLNEMEGLGTTFFPVGSEQMPK